MNEVLQFGTIFDILPPIFSLFSTNASYYCKKVFNTRSPKAVTSYDPKDAF